MAEPGEKAPQCKEQSEQQTTPTPKDQTETAPRQRSRSLHIIDPTQSHTREQRKGDATRWR